MADGTGYGVGLFDSQGPEKFAASIGKITTALTGVSGAFSTFGGSANKSLTSLGSLVDSLTKKLQNLSSAMSNANMGGGGGGGGGGAGGPSSGGGGYTGGSGGTGVAGKGVWLPPGVAGGNAGPATGGAQGNQTVPTGTASAAGSQLVDQWNKFTEGTADDAKALAGSGNKMTNAGNGGVSNSGINKGAAATSLGAAAVGGLGKVLGGSLMSTAVQGQWIGANIGAAYGATGAQQRSMYVIPKGVYAQSAGDYAQANQYMQTYMGANPFQNPNTIAGQNAQSFNRGAQQLMTLNPTMTRQQAMVTQNQMQQPGTLNAGLMFGMNFKPGGKAMDTQSQFNMIYQKLFAGFPGGKPTGDQFASYMSPGGPGENNLTALGITPGSDIYASFMTYAQAKIGMASQHKAMPSDIGTTSGAKAMGGVGKTAAYAQLQAQSAKSQMESRLEPGMADAAKNLNNAAATLLRAASPLASLAGGGIGKLLGGPGLLGGITSHIPGASLGIGLAGKIPGVGGIIKSIFQQGGEVPGTGPQLAVVHGGEFVLTKDDVDKMRGKKGGHGGGNGVGLGAGGGGKGGHGGDKSISNLLASKPTDNEVSTTTLGMLFAAPPNGSLLAGLMKPGGAQQGAGKTAAPAQVGGKLIEKPSPPTQVKKGVPAAGGRVTAAALASGMYWGADDGSHGGLWVDPSTGKPTALGQSLAAGASGAPGAPGAATGTAGPSTTNPWQYKSAGVGPTDLSGMFVGTTPSQTSGGGSGTGGSGGTGSGPPTKLTGSGNAQQAYNYFIGKGLKDFQSAGILGNLAQESGINPGSAQAGGPGRGIAQWSVGGRWDTLVAWAKSANRDPNSLSTQLDFLWKELTGTEAGALAALKGSGNVTDATTAFEQGYERAGTPAMSSRISYAQAVLASKGASYARGTQNVSRTQLAMLHRGEAVVPAADNYSSSPYNKGGAQGGSPIVQLNFKPGSVVLQVPAGANQQDMQNIAQQFVAAISKPQALASVRST